MTRFGVSFSLKYAHEMGVNPKSCLESALKDLGFRRLRLMTYWDLHEPKPGRYDFSELDWQFSLAKKYKARVSLSVGLRQPRWPESHWPEWAQNKPEWQDSLIDYIKAVVKRYKNHPSLVSWQLENEARLTKFGLNGEFSRPRLKKEYRLIKELDSKHPIIMTTSDSWGLPIFGPKPDIYGFSIYRYFYDRGKYRRSRRPALFYKLRAKCIKLLKNRSVFIHELQVEPWGPIGTNKMTVEAQFRSMNLTNVKAAFIFARDTELKPVDLWGLEWWYWLKTQKKIYTVWNHVKNQIANG